MNEYDVPSASDLDLEPPPDPTPAWVEVLLLVVMQVGMLLVMQVLGRMFGADDNVSSVGLFSLFIGAQLFGSLHVRRYPGRMVASFLRRLVIWAGVVHAGIGAAVLAVLATEQMLPPEVSLSPRVLIVAALISAGLVIGLTWLGIKFGALMSMRFDPPTRPAV